MASDNASTSSDDYFFNRLNSLPPELYDLIQDFALSVSFLNSTDFNLINVAKGSYHPPIALSINHASRTAAMQAYYGNPKVLFCVDYDPFAPCGPFDLYWEWIKSLPGQYKHRVRRRTTFVTDPENRIWQVEKAPGWGSVWVREESLSTIATNPEEAESFGIPREELFFMQ